MNVYFKTLLLHLLAFRPGTGIIVSFARYWFRGVNVEVTEDLLVDAPRRPAVSTLRGDRPDTTHVRQCPVRSVDVSGVFSASARCARHHPERTVRDGVMGEREAMTMLGDVPASDCDHSDRIPAFLPRWGTGDIVLARLPAPPCCPGCLCAPSGAGFTVLPRGPRDRAVDTRSRM